MATQKQLPNKKKQKKTPPQAEDVSHKAEFEHDRPGANGQIIATPLETFENLQRATPRDQNGFMLYFLDHTMIPPDFLERAPSAQEDHLKSAQLKLTMLEGYLAFDETSPCWNQLPHEPDSFYQAFRHFLTTAHRNVEAALQVLPPGFSAFTAKEAYVYFYWQERAKAYDILLPIAAAKLREQRIMQMEDTHYDIGNTLLKKLGEEVNFRANADEDGRAFAGLKSSELINAIVAATEIQRVALRMPAKGPRANTGYEPPPGIGIDKAIRESAGHYSGSGDGEVSKVDKMRKAVDAALAESPERAAQLQELALDILMAGRSAKDRTASQDDHS